jgi:hypothetical protein
MGLFRPSRTRPGPDPYLPHLMLIFSTGAGCALAGMWTERAWLVNLGIAVLLAGLALRLFTRRKH